MNQELNIPHNSAQTPITVWAIVLTQFWLTIYSLYWASLLFTQKIDLPPVERAYFLTFTWFDFALIGAVAVVQVVSGLLLFFMRAEAVPAYHLLLALNLFQNGWTLYSKPVEGISLTQFISGTLLTMIMGLYARRLRKNGLLSKI